MWGEQSWLTCPHLIVLLPALEGGARMPCQLRLVPSWAALRPHLLLRMSDRTTATYDQTLLWLCSCDSSFRGGSNALSPALSTQLPGFTFPICLSQAEPRWGVAERVAGGRGDGECSDNYRAYTLCLPHTHMHTREGHTHILTHTCTHTHTTKHVHTHTSSFLLSGIFPLEPDL